MERGIAVIGLGYVGLPVALALAGKFEPVYGFDISTERLDELRRGHDRTREVSREELLKSKLKFTSRAEDLSDCSFFIVTVPTPIDGERRPDLRPVLAACRTVGRVLKPGAVVVFESTVYPGVTREICGPALSEASAASGRASTSSSATRRSASIRATRSTGLRRSSRSSPATARRR